MKIFLKIISVLSILIGMIGLLGGIVATENLLAFYPAGILFIGGITTALILSINKKNNK